MICLWKNLLDEMRSGLCVELPIRVCDRIRGHRLNAKAELNGSPSSASPVYDSEYSLELTADSCGGDGFERRPDEPLAGQWNDREVGEVLLETLMKGLTRGAFALLFIPENGGKDGDKSMSKFRWYHRTCRSSQCEFTFL